jgi:hypothetical protein
MSDVYHSDLPHYVWLYYISITKKSDVYHSDLPHYVWLYKVCMSYV